ncbi:MAG TPA: twin-arginine translocase TatA/TatE family subunit [Gemmatimonadaceae bacterium]|jgi:sec-independent protein translocase protein TatA
MGFDGFGIEKLVLIFLVVLLVFGARRIPEIAGSMGKGIREFKKSLHELQSGAAGEHLRDGADAARPAARSEPSVEEAPREVKRLM